MARIVVATPVVSKQFVLPRRDRRQLADDVAAWAQEIEGTLEHGVWVDHVLEYVVHRYDVIPAHMIGEVSSLQCALEHVVSAGSPLGRDVRLDLDPRTFQIEEATGLVE